MPIGRPPKSLDDLPTEWEKIALDLYKEGASDTEIRVALSLYGETTWYRFYKQYIEFRRVIKIGRLTSKAWWEHQGRTNIDNKEFNSTLFMMNMMNRFGWVRNTEPKKGSETKEQSFSKTARETAKLFRAVTASGYAAEKAS